MLDREKSEVFAKVFGDFFHDRTEGVRGGAVGGDEEENDGFLLAGVHRVEKRFFEVGKRDRFFGVESWARDEGESEEKSERGKEGRNSHMLIRSEMGRGIQGAEGLEIPTSFYQTRGRLRAKLPPRPAELLFD